MKTEFGKLRLQKPGKLALSHGTGANPAAYASYPAPSGFRWEFVTEDGVVVTDGGIPVVDLVGA